MRASLTYVLQFLINTILAVKDEELKKELIPLLLCSQRIKEEGAKLCRHNQGDQEIDHSLPASFSNHQLVKKVFNKHFLSSSKVVGGKCTYFLGKQIRKGWDNNKMISFISTLSREIKHLDSSKQPKPSFQEQVMGVLREAAEEVKAKIRLEKQEQAMQERLLRLKLDAQFPSPPN